MPFNRSRAEVIDFSAPYFHSGVSLLAAPKVKTDIPLLAFLMPFSPELWIAIFIWLNLTAVAVAIYEWVSISNEIHLTGHKAIFFITAIPIWA